MIEQICGLNPLNQVYVFNGMECIKQWLQQVSSLNPLNQVYVFNNMLSYPRINEISYRSLNPLNQVYVFNGMECIKQWLQQVSSLNPLNQVYVFNRKRAKRKTSRLTE